MSQKEARKIRKAIKSNHQVWVTARWRFPFSLLPGLKKGYFEITLFPKLQWLFHFRLVHAVEMPATPPPPLNCRCEVVPIKKKYFNNTAEVPCPVKGDLCVQYACQLDSNGEVATEYCCHLDNLEDVEGNCTTELCPLSAKNPIKGEEPCPKCGDTGNLIRPDIISTTKEVDGGVASEIEYKDKDGTVVGYWAYGSFDPHYGNPFICDCGKGRPQ